jgi:GT2 family glycosyltransferase
VNIDISVIILTWNSGKFLNKCLSSIIESLRESKLPFEIIVVDNGSTDDTIFLLDGFAARWQKNIKTFYLKKNTGTTYSRNVAMKQAKGKYLAIIDSDVEVPIGIFQLLISRLNEDSTIGLVAPKLVYPSGLLQKSTDDFPTVFTKIKRFFFLKKIERSEQLKYGKDVLRDVDYAIAAFWLLPHSVLGDIGYFDENIFYAPEDVDYCLRIRKKKYRVVYDPSVFAIHYAQEISRGFKFNKAFFDHVKGLIYYYAKHNYIFKKPVP